MRCARPSRPARPGCESAGLSDWRQSAYNVRCLKKAYRRAQTLKHSTAQDPDKRAARRGDRSGPCRLPGAGRVVPGARDAHPPAPDRRLPTSSSRRWMPSSPTASGRSTRSAAACCADRPSRMPRRSSRSSSPTPSGSAKARPACRWSWVCAWRSAKTSTASSCTIGSWSAHRRSGRRAPGGGDRGALPDARQREHGQGLSQSRQPTPLGRGHRLSGAAEEGQVLGRRSAHAKAIRASSSCAANTPPWSPPSTRWRSTARPVSRSRDRRLQALRRLGGGGAQPPAHRRAAARAGGRGGTAQATPCRLTRALMVDLLSPLPGSVCTGFDRIANYFQQLGSFLLRCSRLNDAPPLPEMRGMQHREFERVFCQALVTGEDLLAPARGKLICFLPPNRGGRAPLSPGFITRARRRG